MTQAPEYRRLVRLAAGYNRKAENLGLRGRVSAKDLWLIEQTFDDCMYCGVFLEPGHGSFDHILAFDRGGRNAPENITRCCISCQRRKFTKTQAEFVEHQALIVHCLVCGKQFQPRWAEYQRGDARVCSRSCSGRRRWQLFASRSSTRARAAQAGRRRTENKP